jgi:low temperature requirement protein LtrA
MAAFILPIRLRSGDTDAARRVTWLELFFDLAYVAAVAHAASPLAEDYSPAGLGRFAVLFTFIWWAWLGHTLYATRFDPDDMLQRSLTLAQIFGVAVMAINADGPLDGVATAGFVAAFAGLRLLLVVQYLRAWRVPHARPLLAVSSVGTAAAAAIWLGSALVPPPARFILWGLAALIDVATAAAGARYTHDVPPHAAHLPERFGLFTIILLGESLVAVMKGMKTQEAWTWPAASSAVLGVTVAFTLWWWYFEGVNAAGDRHVRTPRDNRLLHAWMYAHLPLYVAIAVTGVGAEHVIEFAPVGHLHAAEAWMLGGAIALAMLAVTALGATRLPRHGCPAVRTAIRRHAGLTLATVIVGVAGAYVPPAPYLLALVVLVIAQIATSVAVDRAARLAPLPSSETPHLVLP